MLDTVRRYTCTVPEGYEPQEMECSPEALVRELKSMIKREFPRSRKVRMIKFADPAKLERERQKI